MNALAKKPYDRARLDVVAGEAIGGLPILELGGVTSVLEYLEGHERRVRSLRLSDALGEACFGGAVAYGTLTGLSEDELRAALLEIAKALATGAPFLFTLTEADRAAIARTLDAIPVLEPIRLEARRPYPFEPPLTQIFVTARRR